MNGPDPETAAEAIERVAATIASLAAQVTELTKAEDAP
jgi:hypothetical protein